MRMHRRGPAAILVAASLAAALQPLTAGPAAAATQCGKASWYALTSRTASGERMKPSALTAAHRSLPFGTRVLVENLANGARVVVRINDRGPFVRGRVIDVSKGAAEALGFVRAGVTRVRTTVIADGKAAPPPASCG